MIEVTRLNGVPMTLNSDLIKIAESSPDTMLTLIHGEKLIVRESCDEIVEKVLAYRARLLAAVEARTRPPGDLQLLVAVTGLSAESLSAATGAAGGAGGQTTGPRNVESIK